MNLKRIFDDMQRFLLDLSLFRINVSSIFFFLYFSFKWCAFAVHVLRFAYTQTFMKEIEKSFSYRRNSFVFNKYDFCC